MFKKAGETFSINEKVIWREWITDERLSPDLLRGRGKSNGGDLNIDDEGSEQNEQTLVVITPLLRWLSIRATRIDLAKKANPCKHNREHKQE
jgi:hypothetical protein